MHRLAFLSFVFCLFCSSTLCQDEASLKPDKAFENKNYPAAIQGYERQLKKNPQDYDSQLHLGICYLESYVDPKKSIKVLEKIKDRKDNDFEVLFYLGQAYHLNYKFDEAISTYQMLADSTSDSAAIKIAKRQIEMCKSGKRLLSQPVDVTLHNLGDTINSSAPDYNVFINEDESMMVFSTQRKKRNKAEGPSSDGNYTADIFISYYEEGAWQKMKSQSKVCTPTHEEIVGLSADGTLMFINVNGRGVKGEMVIAKRKSGSFKTPIKMEKTVNTKATEMTTTVTQDRQKLYYGSNRNGGFGGFDLYEAKRLPDLNWGQSKTLGDQINTPYNELYPQLSPDEKTLYFASEGHNSMGGYDLFRSDWDDKTQSWGPPKNLGYPINTPFDDMHFSINANGSVGYISTYRGDSRGDLDIYSVTFNGTESRKSVITGQILVDATIDYTGAPGNLNKSKTTVPVPIKTALLDVYNQMGDLVGSYATNSSSGNFVLALPPGKYSVELIVDQYTAAPIPLHVFGKGAFEAFIQKNFEIQLDGNPITVPYTQLNK
ncbi:hypothetical protein N9R81_01560 [Flavobacteriales bacterium]|nr:hypothetical protein [Flavobacteriales bacterium]